jgi:zinc protease
MNYLDITPFIHIISHSLDRKKTDIEILLTSGGSWFESPENRGRKHLLEHCILSRTRDLSFQELKDYNFRESIYLNAFTGNQTMGFEASGHYKDFSKIADVLFELFFDPYFDQSDLDREKEIVLREIAERRGEPSYKLHFDIMKQVFTANSSNNHETLGDPDIVASTQLSDFTRLHEQNIKNSHIYICLSGGGIDIEYIVSLVNRYITKHTELFSKDENKLPIDYSLPSKYLPFTTLPIVHELAHKHAEVTLYLDLAINWNNDPTLKIFDNLYLKYGGILYDRLRDDLGLVYGISNSYSIHHQQMMISFSSEISNVTQIIDEVKATFSDFDTYFKPQKFEDFKNVLYKKQEMAEDRAGSMIDFTLSMLKNYGKLESYDDYSKRIKKVSVKDVKRIYQNIQSSLPTLKTIIVSNNPEINIFHKK